MAICKTSLNIPKSIKLLLLSIKTSFMSFKLKAKSILCLNMSKVTLNLFKMLKEAKTLVFIFPEHNIKLKNGI